MPYYAYILECSDGSLYVGHTDNLDQRLADHNSGKGAAWTARRRPVNLLYSESFATESEAVRRERQWKRWTAEKKRALVLGDMKRLKALAKRRVF